MYVPLIAILPHHQLDHLLAGFVVQVAVRICVRVRDGPAGGVEHDARAVFALTDGVVYDREASHRRAVGTDLDAVGPAPSRRRCSGIERTTSGCERRSPFA